MHWTVLRRMSSSPGSPEVSLQRGVMSGLPVPSGEPLSHSGMHLFFWQYLQNTCGTFADLSKWKPERKLDRLVQNQGIGGRVGWCGKQMLNSSLNYLWLLNGIPLTPHVACYSDYEGEKICKGINVSEERSLEGQSSTGSPFIPLMSGSVFKLL